MTRWAKPSLTPETKRREQTVSEDPVWSPPKPCPYPSRVSTQIPSLWGVPYLSSSPSSSSSWKRNRTRSRVRDSVSPGPPGTFGPRNPWSPFHEDRCPLDVPQESCEDTFPRSYRGSRQTYGSEGVHGREVLCVLGGLRVVGVRDGPISPVGHGRLHRLITVLEPVYPRRW